MTLTIAACLAILSLLAFALYACVRLQRCERDRAMWIADYRMVVRDRDEHVRGEARLREELRNFQDIQMQLLEERAVMVEELRKGNGKEMARWN